VVGRFARLLVRLARYRAGVDYDDVGVLLRRAYAARGKIGGGDFIGFGAIDLAPEVDDGESYARIPKGHRRITCIYN
jgi:hypothetical protein